MPRLTGLLLLAASAACAADGGGRPDGSALDGPTLDGATLDGSTLDGAIGDLQPADATVPSCGRFSEGELAGTIAAAAIAEASGLAASHKNPGVIWVHNDAGDPPRLFAVDGDGTLLAVYQLAGAAAADWEDIAVGPGPEGDSYLYVGDIGDNGAIRPSVRVVRIREPLVEPAGPAPAAIELVNYETLELRYPDGAHDAETLMVHPTRGELFVATKSDEGQTQFFVHRLPSGAIDGTSAELEPVATLVFGSGGISGGGKELTAGDISPAGDVLLLRAERMAFSWPWPAGQTLEQVLSTTPCEVALQPELQGEAIGFAADGSGFYSTGEGAAAPLFFYQRLDR